MSEFTRTDFYYILIMWVVLPTVDQYTDIFMILKLLRGPREDQHVKSGIFTFLVDYLRSLIYVFSLNFSSKRKIRRKVWRSATDDSSSLSECNQIYFFLSHLHSIFLILPGLLVLRPPDVLTTGGLHRPRLQDVFRHWQEIQTLH